MKMEEIREFYKKDRFASQAAGIEILRGGKKTASCRLYLEEKHTNAFGGVMGGVLFTLADYTFAIASNTEQPATVTQSATGSYHSGASVGDTLVSEAVCLYDGNRTCAWEIRIAKEGSDKPVATFIFNGYKLNQPGLRGPGGEDNGATAEGKIPHPYPLSAADSAATSSEKV